MSETPSSEDRSAPEGSLCDAHVETPAIATCPRCHKPACVVCWQPAVDRCDTCLKRNAAEAAPPIPWEDRSLGLLRRWSRTVMAAGYPVRTSPAFASNNVAAAVRFACLSFLPLSLIVGIIPHTKTLLFSAPFKITLQGTPLPDAEAIALDVLRAIGAGFALSAAQWLVFAVPYISLVRAYGSPERRHAPQRLMFYRGFLIPLQQTIFMLLAWALIGEKTTPGQSVFLMTISLIPLVLLLSAMWSTARLAAGLGPVVSFLVVIIPVTLWQYVGPLVGQLLP